ncbi:ferredoxin [Streptomyces sp. NPDC058470]|uniref:ferredoxin n=1 Tax=Streptomyces sp. NPDC058470 TaxID=3346515 RepID=UPI00365AFB82
MQITVDTDKCCAAGQCVLAAPEVFDQRDEDGIVVVLDHRPSAGLHAAVQEAAHICPAAAITLS